ncbi:MAG: LacI family DNA-binding transcriptional regulator [Acidobacteria bacterium]|nr:LacI family DNA-binding transcriptional regulator [Acidobacteriota bacterium]
MAIRLQDIADDLNLSKMTISKVLRGQTDVSAETKARVLKRMQELNYRPNISARSLRTGQTYTIGFVVPELNDPRVAAICRGLNQVLRPANYAVVISSADGDPEAEEREAELHLARQVDALLLYGRDDVSDAPEALRATNVPLVYLGQKPAQLAAISVSLRESEVGRLSGEHLLTRGARRIAYLRGPRTAVADQRFSGYLEALHKASVPPRQEWVVETKAGGDEYERGFEAVRTMLQQRSRPEAVIAYSDSLAAGARDAAVAQGLRIPDQFQVLGCGNNLQICSIGMGISSIDLCSEEIGVRAARLALKAIEKKGGEETRSIGILPRLVQRATTKRLESPARPGKRG